MSRLITVLWRDIPSKVIARQGRKTLKLPLSNRFQKAIHRAAMRAGKGGSEAYIADWRREPQACGPDIAAEARKKADQLEASFTDEVLERLVKAGGMRNAGEDPTLSPSNDGTV